MKKTLHMYPHYRYLPGRVCRAALRALLLLMALLFQALPAAAQSPQVAFDSNLTEGQQVANTIRIIGFAVTPQSTGYVEISVDAQSLGRAAYPLPRTDVPNSGFIMEIDTLNFINGTRTIKASAFTAAGVPVGSVTRTLKFTNILAIGSFESPAVGASVAGMTTFTGWALANGGFKRLELQIDGLFAGIANWGLPRSDIQALHPEYGIANGGFQASVNLDQLGLARGHHRVLLVGVDGTDTRRQVVDTDFFYTTGRVGKNSLELPAPGAQVAATNALRVAGWTEGDNPAARVDVYINDRWAGATTNVTTPRPDVPASYPGVKNVGGFDFTLPAFDLGRGRQRITAVVTDTTGLRANIDVLTGPMYFEVGDYQRLFGASLRPAVDYTAAITQYTSEAGTAPDIVMYFQPWRTSTGACSVFNEFPFLPNKVIAAGARVMVTWEPLQDGAGSAQPDFTYARILAGAQDACIATFAQQIKDFGAPVLIRMAHEMNGNSNNWTGIANGNNPPGYVDMYRKVVDMFRAAGATNARFVWSPDHASPPEVPAPASEIKNYFPGTGYVDFIGVSGYNWGNDPLRGGGWVTATQIFDNFFNMILRAFPGKPVLITEIGSVPGYASFVRSDWYADTFNYLAARKDVKGIVWFNDFAFASTDQADFRITNTPGLPTVNAAETAKVRSLITPYRATRDVGTYATVSEFFAPSLNHYFRTAIPEEAASLKANPASGFFYTNKDFRAFLRDDHPVSAQPVCRFYGSLTIGPNSHFYTADAAECAQLKQLQITTPDGQPRWNFEENAFAIDVPASGACPAFAPIPVYRAYNHRAAQNDSNHRYTTDIAVYQQMIALGWNGEGIVMCSPP
jgi:beta-mannanase